MKKSFKIFLVLALSLMICLTLGLISYAEEEPAEEECVHVLDTSVAEDEKDEDGNVVKQKYEKVEPTCTKEGSEKGYCTVCQKNVTIVLPKAPHTFDKTITKAETDDDGKLLKARYVKQDATCTADGYEKGYCTVCEKNIELVLPATGHDFDTSIIEDLLDTDGETVLKQKYERVEPTCTADGYIKGYCKTCEANKETKLPKTGHDYEWSVKTAATCTANGVMRGVCSVCGDETEKPILAKGHRLYKVGETNSTCTVNGMKAHEVCLVCGLVVGPEGGVNKPLLNHSYEWTVKKAATCTENGEKRGVCKDCGKTIDAIITGEHKFVNVSEVPATNDADGKEAHLECIVCGQVVGPAEGIIIPKLQQEEEKKEIVVPEEESKPNTNNSGYIAAIVILSIAVVGCGAAAFVFSKKK